MRFYYFSIIVSSTNNLMKTIAAGMLFSPKCPLARSNRESNSKKKANYKEAQHHYKHMHFFAFAAALIRKFFPWNPFAILVFAYHDGILLHSLKWNGCNTIAIRHICVSCSDLSVNWRTRGAGQPSIRDIYRWAIIFDWQYVAFGRPAMGIQSLGASN